MLQPTGVKVTTKEGECVINLQIDLNINISELAGINNRVITNSMTTEQVKKPEEKVEWAIPDFGTSSKIEFGKGE